MSGFPSVQGVAQARVLIEKASVLRNEIAALKETLRVSSDRLAVAEREFNAAVSERHKLMEKMDCLYPGNFGYENRMQVFLSELVKQASSPAPFVVVIPPPSK